MPQTDTSLSCAILSDEKEIAAIEHEWRELQARAGKSFFTDYDWFTIWWRTLGNTHGRVLHIVTARDHGRLVGLLPLCVIAKKGFRVLQAMGAEAFYFCNVVCEEPWQASSLWQAAKRSPHYDFAHIRDVVPESLAAQSLSPFATLRDRPKTFSLQLQWKNSEEWKASLPGPFRQNCSRRLRNLSQKGPVSYELCEGLPVNTGIIEMLVRNKSAWCDKHGQGGMFDQPNVLDYWLQMADLGARTKTLLLAWIKCGDAIITQNIMFKREKTLYVHSLAIDTAWNKYAPGTLAIMNAISWAIDNGFECVDHRQGESEFKMKFSNQIRECPEFSFHRSLKGWIGETLFFQRRRLQRRKAESKAAAVSTTASGQTDTWSVDHSPLSNRSISPAILNFSS
jgi:CelD/BcsL family acetyltransferase involved in cellulose biosynthesis